MFNDTLKLSLKVIIFVFVYYILDYYFEDNVIILILVIVIAGYIGINILLKRNPDSALEMLCDVNKYLEKVQIQYSKGNQNIFNTKLAYAYIYKGDYELANNHIYKVDKDMLKRNSKILMIYYLVLLKLAFEEKDLDKFNAIYNEYENIMSKKYKGINAEVLKVPKYLLEENYSEAIDKLQNLIPLQKKKYLIIELEYYLGLAYLETNRKEDAAAVLEFVGSKHYNLIYVEKCNNLLKGL